MLLNQILKKEVQMSNTKRFNRFVFSALFLISLSTWGTQSFAENESLGPILSEILSSYPELKIEDSSATVSLKRGTLGLRYIMHFGELAKEIQVALHGMGISSDAFNAFYSLHANLNPERFSFTDTIAKLKGHYYGQEFKPTPEQAVLWQKRQLLDVIKPNLESSDQGVQVDPKLKVVIAGEDYIERVIHDLVYSNTRSDDDAERKFKTIFVDLNTGLALSLSEDTVDESQKVFLSVSRLVHQTKDKISYQLKPSYDEVLQSMEGLYIEYETLLSKLITNYNSRLTNSDKIRRSQNVHVADTVQQVQRDSYGIEGKREFSAEGEVYLLFDSPLNPEDLVYIIKSVVEYAAKMLDLTTPKGNDQNRGTSLNPANHLQTKSCQSFLFGS